MGCSGLLQAAALQVTEVKTRPGSVALKEKGWGSRSVLSQQQQHTHLPSPPCSLPRTPGLLYHWPPFPLGLALMLCSRLRFCMYAFSKHRRRRQVFNTLEGCQAANETGSIIQDLPKNKAVMSVGSP